MSKVLGICSGMLTGNINVQISDYVTAKTQIAKNASEYMKDHIFEL